MLVYPNPTSVRTFSHPTAHFPFQHSRDLANCGRARPATRDRPSSSQRAARSRDTRSTRRSYIHIDRCDRLPRKWFKTDDRSVVRLRQLFGNKTYRRRYPIHFIHLHARRDRIQSRNTEPPRVTQHSYEIHHHHHPQQQYLHSVSAVQQPNHQLPTPPTLNLKLAPLGIQKHFSATWCNSF